MATMVFSISSGRRSSSTVTVAPACTPSEKRGMGGVAGGANKRKAPPPPRGGGGRHDFIPYPPQLDPQELILAEGRENLSGHRRGERRPLRNRPPLEAIEDRLHQQIAGNDRRDGIPRNPDDGAAPDDPEHHRVPRADRDPMHKKLPQFPDDGGGKVFRARRRTGIDDDHVVGRQRFLYGGPDRGEIVRDDAGAVRLSSPLPNHPTEHQGIELDDLAGLHGTPRWDQLAPGRDDGHAGPLADLNGTQTASGDGPEIGRGEGMSFGKDQLRRDHVFPHGPDMVPRGYGGVDLDFLFAYRVQVLEHDDSVERREDRGTRIDPLKLLPRPQPHGGRF